MFKFSAFVGVGHHTLCLMPLLLARVYHFVRSRVVDPSGSASDEGEEEEG